MWPYSWTHVGTPSPLAPPVPRAPLWAPLGTGSADAAHPDALAAPANPAAMPMRDS